MTDRPLDILILFPFEWAPYSTPLLNFVEVAGSRHKVTVLSAASAQFHTDELPKPVHETLVIRDEEWKSPFAPAALLARYLNALKLPHSQYPPYEVAKMLRMVAEIERRSPDLVIAVDALGLLLATQVFDRVVYFSLELSRDEFFPLADAANIQCVITQTQERYAWFFGDRNIERHFIPNSDFFRGKVPRQNHHRIIYFGNVTGTHGMSLLPDLVRLLPDCFTLTLAGMVVGPQREWIANHAADILSSGRLLLEDRYIPQDQTLDYLSRFSTGLCFYDFESLKRRAEMECSVFERPPLDDTLKKLYTTTKIYNYFSAGIPVIGTDAPCMQPVRDHGCGILLDHATPESIAEAVIRIDREHDRYSDAAYRAAEACDYTMPATEFMNDFLGSGRAGSIRRSRFKVGGGRGRLIATLAEGLRRRRKEMLDRVRARLDEIRTVTRGEPIVVYGAGRHTRWLMLHTSLSSMNLSCAVDSNPRLWGRRRWNLSICKPDDVLPAARWILVSSYSSQREISTRLKSAAPQAEILEIYPNRKAA